MRLTVVDHSLAELAARQHGAFSRRQAYELGASGRFVDRRLEQGLWVRLDQGVYALATSPGTWLRQLKAAELGTPGSAVAGRSAAVLHRIEGFSAGRPEVLVPASARTRCRIAIVHRYAGAELVQLDGFRVTSLVQTLFDLAVHEPAWRVERALDSQILDRRTTLDELAQRLTAYTGSHRHGVGVMRALLEERSESAWQPTESALERLLLRLLARLEGEEFAWQVTFEWRPASPHRVDVVHHLAKVIIEVDGRRWHARYADFDRDRWLDALAASNGYVVLRFTWNHLTQSPEEALRLIRSTIAHRRRHATVS